MAQRELCVACRRPIAAWPEDPESMELCFCRPDWEWHQHFVLVPWPDPPPARPARAH